MVNLQEIAGIMCRTGLVYPRLILSMVVLLVVAFSGKHSSSAAFDDQMPANSDALPATEPENAI